MPAIMKIKDLTVEAGGQIILNKLCLDIQEKAVTSFVGPSGVGKSTLLRTLNRLTDDESGLKIEGEIEFNNESIFQKSIDVKFLRRAVGIVFQKPIIFPISVLENVLFGVRHIKKIAKDEGLELAQTVLKESFLWEEVKNRLNKPALRLSIGQQQRLAIARTLALKPKVLLLDEPTASLDSHATQMIEDLITTLKDTRAIVLVTHDLPQARKMSDRIVEFKYGTEGAKIHIS